jgi:hypothetical protein
VKTALPVLAILLLVACSSDAGPTNPVTPPSGAVTADMGGIPNGNSDLCTRTTRICEDRLLTLLEARKHADRSDAAAARLDALENDVRAQCEVDIAEACT